MQCTAELYVLHSVSDTVYHETRFVAFADHSKEAPPLQLNPYCLRCHAYREGSAETLLAHTGQLSD
jgi:hypothetical protein